MLSENSPSVLASTFCSRTQTTIAPLRRRARGRRVLLQVLLGAALSIFATETARAQTSYSGKVATAWNAARWNNAADGPTYDAAYTPNNDVNFSQSAGGYSFAGMGASINVGNVVVADNVAVAFTANSGTFGTGGTVRTLDIGSQGSFDFGTQAISTVAGTGFIKDGAGTLRMGAGAIFNGGFTLNQGTVVASGVNAFGQGGTLNLNGGIVAVNDGVTRNFTGKFSAINIGGNVQFGAPSLGSGSMTFGDNMDLGAQSRTFTIGSSGIMTFAGVISNSGSEGIAFNAVAGGTGRFDLTNTANTFTGPININGGEVRIAVDGNLGNATNSIVLDGGRLSTVGNGNNTTIASARSIAVGNNSGTAINISSATTFYDGVVTDKAGEVGSLTKQGIGTLVLGGVSNYSGTTSIAQGTLRLAKGDDRLPTGTVVTLGAGNALGTLDLNGFNQTVAGLSSTTGTNTVTLNNTVTSTTAATLTLGGSGTYAYGDGSNPNSGVITGAISVVKNGTGTQTFGDANTYTGTTSIDVGVLRIRSATGLGSVVAGTSVAAGAALQLQIGVTGTGIAVGNEALTLNGTGVGNTGALRNVSGVNTYAGLVTLGSDSRINTDAGSLSLTNTGTITGSGMNLTVGGAANTSIASVIGTDSGSLTKDGLGTLTLSGANTFNGGVTVLAGTVNVTGSLAEQQFNVASGATLTSASTLLVSGATNIDGTVNGALSLQSGATLNGSGMIIGDLTVNGALAPGNSIGTLSVGNLIWNGDGAPWTYDLGPVNTSDLVTITGNFNKGTGSLFGFDFGGSTEVGTYKLVDWTLGTTFSAADFSYTGLGVGNSGSFDITGNQLNFTVTTTAVPEPSSMVLLGLASATGVVMRFRRKRGQV